VATTWPQGELLFLVPKQAHPVPATTGAAQPCGTTLTALHHALTKGVGAQLRLVPAPSLEMVWGSACDPVNCTDVYE